MTRCSQKSTKSAEWLADRIELDVKAGRFEKGRRRLVFGETLTYTEAKRRVRLVHLDVPTLLPACLASSLDAKARGYRLLDATADQVAFRHLLSSPLGERPLMRG